MICALSLTTADFSLASLFILLPTFFLSKIQAAVLSSRELVICYCSQLFEQDKISFREKKKKKNPKPDSHLSFHLSLKLSDVVLCQKRFQFCSDFGKFHLWNLIGLQVGCFSECGEKSRWGRTKGLSGSYWSSSCFSLCWRTQGNPFLWKYRLSYTCLLSVFSFLA